MTARTQRTRRLIAAALAGLVAVTSVACATRAPSDSIVLYYKSGVGDNKTFSECIQPGTNGANPIDDEIFYLPTSLRTWNMRTQGGDSDQPVRSGTRPKGDQPGPEVAIWTVADFYLNTDCAGGANSPIVRFWESTGRRYGVSKDGEDGFNEKAWRSMLLNTLVAAQEKALRTLARAYDADALDANAGGIWSEIDRRMAPLFQAELRAKVGGDYFCGSGFNRGKDVEWTELVEDGVDEAGLPKVREEKRKGKCPPVRITISDVSFADPGIAAARAKVFEAEQNAKAALIAAQSQVDVAAKLAQAGKDPGYVRLRELEVQLAIAQQQLEAAKVCSSNPNCTVVVGGAGVNVTTK